VKSARKDFYPHFQRIENKRVANYFLIFCWHFLGHAMNCFDLETGKCLGTFPEQYLPPVPTSGESGLETRSHGDNSTEKKMQMWRLFRSREYTGPK
jgi:hypothetical protein